METTPASPAVRYLVEEDGRRVGVVLRWEDYTSLRTTFSTDPDLLTGLNGAELQVLAEGVLSSRYQARLNELLQRNREEGLVASEERELDRLLERVNLLNVLKARAMYTLQQQQEAGEKGTRD